MSRLTTAYVNALKAPTINLAYFARFFFRSGTVRMWTGYGNITWDSQTWAGTGQLASIDRIDESAEVEAPGFSFSLTGIPSEILALASAEQYRYRKCELWQAVMNDEFTAVTASVRLFGGNMSHMLLADSGASGNVTLFAENELARLNQKNEIRYTDEHQRALFPTDTGLRFIHNTVDTAVFWGRYQSLGDMRTDQSTGQRVSVGSIHQPPQDNPRVDNRTE